MNKHLIVIGVVILLLAVGLSGCSEIEENQFSGTWTGFVEIEINSGGILLGVSELTFSGDNVHCAISTKIDSSITEVAAFEGIYKTEGTTLIITFSEDSAFTFTYRFEGNETVYLDDSKFTKQ